ncbi:MAG: ketose-bisphosphate aldolase [Bifidobacteriaceae bacterium]|jgi:fructose-bisphosphate aldolase class II|nr:ketose-bisphosphate aldolase [Bifidobacteriaceae bacterium]
MLVNGSRLLQVAYEKSFAVPAFNISDWSMLKGIVAECESLDCPVILGIHPRELEHVGWAFIDSTLALARAARVPVAVHLDHGELYSDVLDAIRLGYTSVMIDGSLLEAEANVDLTRKVVEAAHALDMSVEGEIGTIGPRDVQDAAEAEQIVYTRPEEAARFVAQTGVDSLAVAIGTCHGVYPAGMVPKLKIDLLEQIRQAVDLPLVLHGGSGNPDSEVALSVKHGIAKVNISSDIKVAYFDKLREVLTDPKLREPHDIHPPAVEAMMACVRHKVEVLGATGSARHYR